MRVILFDLDDTLFDQRYCSRAGLAAVRKTYAGRIDGSLEELETAYNTLLEQWHEKVLAGSISIDDARIERFRVLLSSQETMATREQAGAAADCYRNAYNAAYRPVPGAIELLRRVKGERRIGIVTNHVVSEQVKKIAAIGVEPFVDELVVSEEVGVPKPDARIFAAALSRLDATPDEAVMIGDSWSSDIVGAAGMGISAVWLNRYDLPCPDSSLAPEIRALVPVDEVVDLLFSRS